MKDIFKVFSVSTFAFINVLTEYVNPFMSFLLVLVTVLYTFQKFRNECKKHKSDE